MREFTIEKNDAGQRLDKFITKALDIPKSLLYKSIRLKKIKVNRKRAEPNTMLALGDTVQCFLAEEFFEKGKKAGYSESSDLKAESLSRISATLSIIYEDENIILINKPEGLSVHEDEVSKNNTLITYLLTYLYKNGEYDPNKEASFTPALCNRIDRNTTGIVIGAKTAEALRVMNEKIKLREVKKFYLAAVHGIPKKKEATISGYLIKDEKTNTVKVYDKKISPAAKDIKTKYRVISVNKERDLSLVEVELLTGRTHQIRAHMAYIGHPLLGDGKYGKNKADRAIGYTHQALASYRLVFDFSNESTALDYLRGREFEIPAEKINFLKLF